MPFNYSSKMSAIKPLAQALNRDDVDDLTLKPLFFNNNGSGTLGS